MTIFWNVHWHHVAVRNIRVIVTYIINGKNFYISRTVHLLFDNRTGIHFYDETKCRWETFDQEPCSTDVETSSPTSTSTTTTSTTTASTTTTTTTTSSTTTSPEREPVALATEPMSVDVFVKPVDDNLSDNKANLMAVSTTCNELELSWRCSNANNNLSLCTRACSVGDNTEYKRCVCKGVTCEWQMKGEKCPVESNKNSDTPTFSSLTGNFRVHLLKSPS